MSQELCHVRRTFTLSDFPKQICIWHIPYSLRTEKIRCGAGCSNLGSWLKINGSLQPAQRLWGCRKKLKSLVSAQCISPWENHLR